MKLKYLLILPYLRLILLTDYLAFTGNKPYRWVTSASILYSWVFWGLIYIHLSYLIFIYYIAMGVLFLICTHCNRQRHPFDRVHISSVMQTWWFSRRITQCERPSPLTSALSQIGVCRWLTRWLKCVSIRLSKDYRKIPNAWKSYFFCTSSLIYVKINLVYL